MKSLPVFGTIASQFNDPGMNQLYRAIVDGIESRKAFGLHSISNSRKE